MKFPHSLSADGWQRRSEMAKGHHRPELRLHVQVANHRQLERRQNQLPVPLCGRFVHVGIRVDGGHRFQGEDGVPKRETRQAADMGMYYYTECMNGHRIATTEPTCDWLLIGFLLPKITMQRVHRIPPARNVIVPLPPPTIAEPWASFLCTTSPMRRASIRCRTGT